MSYFRDDEYFDEWDDTLKEYYFKKRGFHLGVMYNGLCHLVMKYGLDCVIEEITRKDLLKLAIEHNCLDDILHDIPDLKNHI